jgi:hypothetical protein
VQVQALSFARRVSHEAHGAGGITYLCSQHRTVHEGAGHHQSAFRLAAPLDRVCEGSLGLVPVAAMTPNPTATEAEGHEDISLNLEEAGEGESEAAADEQEAASKPNR